MELIMKLLDSSYLKVVNALDFTDEIVKIKCNNSISIVDSSVITTAKWLGINTLFKMEKELKDNR
nr:hypothetical protein [Sulfolobus sp. S-194]